MAASVDRLRIAVVGSGAAAAGVLLAIARRFPHSYVVLVERQREAIRLDKPPADHRPDPAFWQHFYVSLRSQNGLTFPPPKTHFGVSCPRLPVENRGFVWESRERGGLTNYWGGMAAVFTDRDFRRWPFGVTELVPFYRMAAKDIGIAGQTDVLTSLFKHEIINRPPVRPTETTRRLIDAVNTSGPQQGFEIKAGTARLAVETRASHPRACTYTGDCMIGCSREAIYCATGTVETFIRSGSRVVGAKVLAFDAASLGLMIEDEQSGRHEHIGPFDFIFLAAGCIGTAEIVLRSNSNLSAIRFRDNPVASFPILYSGGLDDRSVESYFALTNGIVVGMPADVAEPAFSVQVYPAMDHLWRYFTPVSLWKLMQPFGRMLRRRLLIGRLYLHSEYGPAFSLSLSRGSKPEIRLEKARIDQPGAWTAVRAALNREGFHVPNLRPVRHFTSSHYSASLPYGTAGLSPTGEISPRIFACDSSVFPNAPASPPTLTIIANAMRTVYAAADRYESAKA